MLGDPITEITIAMEVDYFQLNGAEYYVSVQMKIPRQRTGAGEARGGGAHPDRIHRRTEGRV